MDPIIFISKFKDSVMFTRHSMRQEIFVNGKRVADVSQTDRHLHSYRRDGKTISLVRGMNEDSIEINGIRTPLTGAKFINVASCEYVFILTGKNDLKYLLNTNTMKKYKVARTCYDVTNGGTVLYYDELGRQMFKTIDGEKSFMRSQDSYHATDGNKIMASNVRVLALNNGFEFNVDCDVIVSSKAST